VRAYPGSAFVYDSLGEAQRAAGDTKAALASYERSLAMDPWNTNAADVLAQLRAAR
jgi:cytochrome c-type biogenesis protein CcmH/NrfG